MCAHPFSRQAQLFQANRRAFRAIVHADKVVRRRVVIVHLDDGALLAELTVPAACAHFYLCSHITTKLVRPGCAAGSDTYERRSGGTHCGSCQKAGACSQGAISEHMRVDWTADLSSVLALVLSSACPTARTLISRRSCRLGLLLPLLVLLAADCRLRGWRAKRRLFPSAIE